MRIAHITPSAGGSFYCENCLRDAALVTAMDKLGHDLLTVPLYLPLETDQSAAVAKAPIFFGGINVYLQQKFAFFRKTPRWFDKIWDSPKLLNLVSRKAGMTSAKELGETTISMLRGEHGRQIKELHRLIDWLVMPANKPDIVCLSNVLLIGLAESIKKRLGVPVVCLLQDEDGFLDGLPSPYSEQAWRIITKQTNEVDVFIGVSKYYADDMQKRLNLNPQKLHVVYAGILLDGIEARQKPPQTPTIGYLSRMCPDKGLDTLIEAFIILKKNPELKNVKLRITGGKMAGDEKFLNKIQKQLTSHGFRNDVEFLHDFDARHKHAFLKSLSVLSVPEKQPVAYGLYVLESLAAGVPVVEPAIGVFPGLVEMTGGGLLYEPNNANKLAAALESLLLKPDYLKKLGEQGRKAVFEKFNIEQTAAELVRIYQSIAQ